MLLCGGLYVELINLLRQALQESRLVQSFSGVRSSFGLGRDIAPELEVLAKAYGYCYAAGLTRRKQVTLLISRDPRPTGEAIAEALQHGFVAGAISRDYELSLVNLGIMTTPLAESAVRALKAQGGVMITASHNPIEDNGFKFLSGVDDDGPDAAPPGALLSAAAMSKVIAAVHQLAQSDGRQWHKHLEMADATAVRAAQNRIDSDAARMQAERAYLDSMGKDWGLTPHCLQPLTLGPVLVDPNGGASCGIGARVLEHFGVKAVEINAEQGFPEHGIDYDGIDPASGRHMLLRVSRAAVRYHCHFGVAFDYDADRGNLVLPGRDESVIIPPQRVATFNVAIVLSRRRWEVKQGIERGKLAIVASDATSLATHRVAAAFGADVFQVETGEINVVSKMHALRQAGYDVPVGVEGANGGTIFASATCRDGLQVALSAALAESSPELLAEWAEVRRTLMGKDARHIMEAKNVLAALIDSIPLNSNVMLKLEAPPMPQAEFKRRLEGIFVSVIWPQLQARFTTYAFQNFEGMQQVDVRTGDESGAWRILLSAPGRQAFVFVRGSRTEAGVWRMIIDADDAEDFGILRPLAEEMFQHAGDGA